MSYSDNISKKQVARILGVSESTVVRLSKTGEFPLPYKLGGRTFYSEAEIKSWVELQKSRRITV